MNRETYASSVTDEWGTPPEVFEPLLAEFGMDLDVCASPGRELLPCYYSPENNGLSRPWASLAACAWMNPPYGRTISAWVAKAVEEAQRGCTVVALLPARTDTRWWHDHVIGSGAEVRFLRGRVRFIAADGKRRASAPFPSAVVIFRGAP